VVWDPLIGLARLDGRQHIVSKAAERFDYAAASFCLIASSISCRCTST
jgi:hypothetical protein